MRATNDKKINAGSAFDAVKHVAEVVAHQLA
jgi:hypothetical protein